MMIGGFIGEYQHSVDQKGRINFPAKFREDLGVSFVITKGQDYCLYVYSLDEWQALTDSIKSLPRSKRRDLEHFFFSSASLAQPDKQGRVMIPALLREYAGIQKDVSIVGATDRVEIWNAERWKKESESLSPEVIGEKMDDLDF